MPEADEGTVGRSIFEGLSVKGFSKMLSNKIRLINLLDDKFSSVFEGASAVI